MSALEIKATRAVELSVLMGGQAYIVNWSGEANGRLEILGVGTYDEAKRFLAILATGLAPQAPAAAALAKPPEPEKKAEALPPEAKPAPAPAALPSAAQVPEKLAKAEKLRDVLGYLAEQGIRGEAKVVAECEKLKDSVPALRRIPNIAERVKRALVMFEVPADA